MPGKQAAGILGIYEIQRGLQQVRQLLRKMRESIVGLISLDIVRYSETKRRKLKLIALSLIVPFILGVVRVYIKGHYTDFYLWFGLALGLAVFSWVFFLWIVESWTNLIAWATAGTILPLTVLFYAFFVNVVFSFSLRRFVFALMFFISLIVFILLIYITGSVANILNTHMFKKVDLSKVAFGGLLLIYIFVFIILQAITFLGIYYILEGEISWQVLALIGGMLIAFWYMFNISVIFVLWRSLVLGLVWGAIFGIIAFIIPPVLFIILGRLNIVLMMIVLLPWLIWETLELLVYRTSERNWWGIMVVFIALLVFLSFS